MAALTCENVVSVASDFLDNVLDSSMRDDVEAHLGGCDDCPTYLAQLRVTIGVLGERPEVSVPDELRQAVDDAMVGTDDRKAAAQAFEDHSEHLYLLAAAISTDAAEDLVQATLLRAFDEGAAAFGRDRLSQIMLDIAADNDANEGRVYSVYDHDGGADRAVDSFDADADTAELFYPEFYSDGPETGAWAKTPNSWPGESRVLAPDVVVATGEVLAAVDAALNDLDSFTASVVALIDLDGATSHDAADQLGWPHDDVRRALHVGRNHVRGSLDSYFADTAQ
jgi:DNA-directed RNA polymerase specialized sigma24 family protein